MLTEHFRPFKVDAQGKMNNILLNAETQFIDYEVSSLWEKELWNVQRILGSSTD